MQSAKYPSSTRSASVCSICSPHVPCPIAHQGLADPLSVSVVDTHALVIDADLFIGNEVVPNQHLLLAANQRGPDLYGGKPVHVDVGDDVLWEIDGHERNVFDAVQVLLAGGDNGFRLLLDQVIHDREVVRRQVPNNAHVVLKQAQVDAQRIVVI